MATFLIGKTGSLTVNSQDYSGLATKVDTDLITAVINATTMGASYHKTALPGLQETKLSYELLYSQVEFLALRTLWSGRTTHSVIFGPTGVTTGMPRLTVSGFIASMKTGFTAEGLPSIVVTHQYGLVVPVFDVY